ncbi:hypothetical protein DENSPDRAFT_83839 [Dentipellis sp. KUC8613]|nr:hypothetical protein DENSPDRAFT_83839 [Dentipellis sp. KUC8613]
MTRFARLHARNSTLECPFHIVCTARRGGLIPKKLAFCEHSDTGIALACERTYGARRASHVCAPPAVRSYIAVGRTRTARRGGLGPQRLSPAGTQDIDDGLRQQVSSLRSESVRVLQLNMQRVTHRGGVKAVERAMQDALRASARSQLYVLTFPACARAPLAAGALSRKFWRILNVRNAKG